MTVVVVIAVAGLMAFFSMVAWPIVREGIKRDTNCSDAICTGTPNNGTIECYMKDDPTNKFRCPYKG